MNNGIEVKLIIERPYENFIKLAGQDRDKFNAIYLKLSAFIKDKFSMDFSLKCQNKKAESVLFPATFINKLQEFSGNLMRDISGNDQDYSLICSFFYQVNEVSRNIEEQKYYVSTPSNNFF